MAANDNLDELTAPLAEMLGEPIDPRTLPVRYSRLKHIDRSPAHYFHECQAANDNEQTISMRLGSGVHAMVFNQPHSRYLKRRAGNDWNLYRADHPGHVILNAAEWERASACANAITTHPAAMHALFSNGAIIEREIAWRYCGRACSSRPDSVSPYAVTDLKTTRDASPGFFIREALRASYHVQLAAYREAFNHHAGVMPERAFIVACETAPPFPVAVYEVSPRALEQGARTWAAWFERLLVCEQTCQWPGYADTAMLLDVPEDPFTTWSAA